MVQVASMSNQLLPHPHGDRICRVGQEPQPGWRLAQQLLHTLGRRRGCGGSTWIESDLRLSLPQSLGSSSHKSTLSSGRTRHAVMPDLHQIQTEHS
jgi:hypothetical protein